MPFDWTHLASELRRARGKLGLTQAELAARAGVSEKTIKNLESRDSNFKRWPKTLNAVELALEKPEGWARETALSDPATRQKSPAAVPNSTDATADLPPAVRIALGMGELLGYDVWTTDVDGEPMQMIQLAVTNAQAVDALKKQLDRFGAITGYVRRQESVSNGADGDSVDE